MGNDEKEISRKFPGIRVVNTMLRTKGCCKAKGLINGEISIPGADDFTFEQMELKNKDRLSKHGTDIPEQNKNVSKSIYERLRAFWKRISKLFTHD